MAEETTEEAEPKTRRQELEELLQAMAEEQADAMDELLAYIISSEVGGLKARLRTAVEKTIPSSMFETTINNTLTVLESLTVVLPQARANLPAPAPAPILAPPPPAE